MSNKSEQSERDISAYLIEPAISAACEQEVGA